MSLGLAYRLKPVVNSLMKCFTGEDFSHQSPSSVSSNALSFQKGKLQLKQMQNFIIDFIEYIEMKKNFSVAKDIDLKNVLNKVLKKLENHSHRPKNLNLKTDIKKNLIIPGSSSHLEKSFEHIVINAFEALNNQEKPKLYIQTSVDSSWIILKFVDNGHGIEREDIKQLFSPLFSNRFGLRGLGLAYVQKALQLHGAFIDVDSSNQGSTFVIKFPLKYHSYNNQKIKNKKIVA